MIERVPPPSAAEFVRRYRRTSRPVVITGLLESWLAYGKWTLDYIREQCGSSRVGVFRVRHGEVEITTERGSRLEMTSVDACIEAMGRMSGPDPDGTCLSTPLGCLPAGMRNDVEVPPYCATYSWVRSRVFASMPGTVTSLHHDLPHNLYAMLAGAKRWTLFPPRPSSVLYPNPFYSKAPNHSRLDPEQPDYDRFPGFRGATPQVVDLKAGETLFIPRLWWHHVRSLDPEPSISVNFWWATGWAFPVAWAAATYKRLRNI